MKTSIATFSISGNLVEKLEAIAAVSFDRIEIFEQDFIAHDGPPREVRELIPSMGLGITLFQPFRNFEGLPAPFVAPVASQSSRDRRKFNSHNSDLS